MNGKDWQPVIINKSFEKSEIERLLAKFFRVRGKLITILFSYGFTVKCRVISHNFLVCGLH